MTMQVWENRSYLHILYFELEILNALFFSCGTMQSRQIYYMNSLLYFAWADQRVQPFYNYHNV